MERVWRGRALFCWENGESAFVGEDERKYELICTNNIKLIENSNELYYHKGVESCNHMDVFEDAGAEMNENSNEKWVSIEDAAEHLGVKPVTIRNWIRNRKSIPAHKIGKQWKFQLSELDEWVKSGDSANV